MAASLTRPDPSSPTSIADAGFSTTRRGFNQDEVRAFLTSVAAELSRMQDRERELEAELRDLRAGSVPAELDEEVVASLLGEETVRVLQAARESASEIKVRAEESAARILREANETAKQTRHEAEIESARRRQDAASSAEAEIALAKQQGREMVNEARAYRERVLADLERRTTLARNQIEELLHGRDRLLQVFERARLVAVDVTSELQAVDSPDELVNLTPTTGPVPVMVPNSPRPDEADAGDDATAARDTTDVDTTDADESDADESDVDESDAEAADETVDVVAELVDDVADHVDAVVEQLEVGEEEIEIVTDDDVDDDVEDDLIAVVEAAGDDPSIAERTDDTANVVELFRGRQVDEDDVDRTDDIDDDIDEIDEIADEDAEDEADRPDVGGLFARLRDEVDQPDESADSDGVAVGEVVVSVPTTAPIEAGAADPIDPADPADTVPSTDAAFMRRDEALVPLIVSSARALKRVLADEQNGVLDALRGKRPVAALDDVLPELDAHVDSYASVLHDELVEAAAVGAGEVSEVTAAVRKRLDPDALGDAHRLLRTDLIAPLRDRLERAIVDGSGDNEAIAKTIRSVYREWKTQHIDDQLDDVFRYAHGGGIVVAADGAPLVWTTDPSQTASPDCEDNSLAGAIRAGEAYPTGHTSAPAHPGCRCLTLPPAR